MGWVRVDDHFNEHPKLARVGPLGWGIWLAGLGYCNRNLTDGFIPRASARSLGDFEVVLEGEVFRLAVTSGMAGADLDAAWVIDLLVEAGLWAEVEGGYRVHDYHDYQPSKERVLAERARTSARVSRHRNAVGNGVTSGVGNGLVTMAPNPNPSDTSSLRSDAVACFDYWRDRCRHPASKFTSDRKRKVEGRLKEGYTVEQIKQAIDGAARAAFVNDAGKRFDDLELICRSGSKLEDFMSRSTARPSDGLSDLDRKRLESTRRQMGAA